MLSIFTLLSHKNLIAVEGLPPGFWTTASSLKIRGKPLLGAEKRLNKPKNDREVEKTQNLTVQRSTVKNPKGQKNMAVIDTNQIQGFAEMSAEDQVKALLSFQIPESVDLTKYVSKEVFDKKATEAAGLSKQLKERMSEAEIKAEEDKKAQEAMKNELESLRKERTVAQYESRYLNLGYDAELAKSTAKALADGDMETVFKNGQKHSEAAAKKLKESLMMGDPRPGGADKKETDAAVEKAKELAKARGGQSKSYDDVLSKYKTSK